MSMCSEKFRLWLRDCCVVNIMMSSEKVSGLIIEVSPEIAGQNYTELHLILLFLFSITTFLTRKICRKKCVHWLELQANFIEVWPRNKKFKSSHKFLFMSTFWGKLKLIGVVQFGNGLVMDDKQNLLQPICPLERAYTTLKSNGDCKRRESNQNIISF